MCKSSIICNQDVKNASTGCQHAFEKQRDRATSRENTSGARATRRASERGREGARELGRGGGREGGGGGAPHQWW